MPALHWVAAALILYALPRQTQGDDCYAKSCGAPTSREDVLLQSWTNARNGKVQPLDCSKHTAPIQVLLQRNGFSARELDIESGKYTLLYDIPFSRTSPPYKWLNGCALGPLDNIAYCSILIGNDDGYLVRLDKDRIEFLSKLPWSYRAAFDESGTLHMYVGDGGMLYSFPRADKLKGFSSQRDRGLPSGSEVGKALRMDAMGADLVVVTADFEGKGESEYLVSAHDGQIYISSIGSSQTWRLSGPDGRTLPTGTFGAGWNYQGRIFFGSNGGEGVYEVFLDTVDLRQGHVVSGFVGPSVSTPNNDGMNCMREKPPPQWVPPCRPGSAELSFADSKVMTNNLGGRGPTKGPNEIRLRGVVPGKGGAAVDMVITAIGNYRPDNSAANGLRGQFLSVSVKPRQTAVINVRFEDAATQQPVQPGQFEMTFVDIDRDHHDELRESIVIGGFDRYVVEDDNDISIEKLEKGRVAFTSKGFGSACDDPTDPKKLRTVTCGGQTIDQGKRSALVMFSNTTSINITFKVGRGPKGRSFLFASASSLNTLCSATTTRTTTSTTTESETTTITTVEATTTTTTSASMSEIGMCVLWGDPHVNVFDNAQLQKVGKGSDVRIADHGDFWIVRHEQIHIQGRYWAANSLGASSMRALAVSGPFLQDHKLVVQPMDGRLFWDGKEVLSNTTSSFSFGSLVKAHRHTDGQRIDANSDHLALHILDVELPQGVNLTINRYDSHIDAMISMPRPSGPVDGHCGNWNNDPADDTADAIKQRLGGQVSEEQDLFTQKSYEFVGCFKDEMYNRDLGTEKGSGMKLHDCALACSDFGYFGRQWLGQCFCGSSYGKHGALEASDCACEAENIGGNRNCVYKYDGEALLPIAPATVNLRLDGCEASKLERAVRLCSDAVTAAGGTPTKDFLDSCAFDVCFADDSFATAGVAMQKQMIKRADEIKHENILREKDRKEKEEKERTEHPNMVFDFPAGQGLIRWASHPDLCWSLATGQGKAGLGTAIQLARCDVANEFVVPTSGSGLFKVAADPTLCVDVRGGVAEDSNKLQLWTCDSQRPHPNMVFTVPSANSVLTRWAAHPEFCFDVDGGQQHVGARIQIWSCN